VSEDIIGKITSAILDGDEDDVSAFARELIADPASLPAAVDAAIGTIRAIGDQFEDGEIFLPEMIIAAETMQAFMEIVKPHLDAAGGDARVTGKVVLATVKGDIHTIGKDIVATMYRAAGYDVIDMGVDVTPMDVIQTAEQADAQIIGLSALMTTSMPYQKEVIDLLTELKMRDKFWVILGGGPVTPEYSQEVGADGWAANAAGAVPLSERMLTSDGTSTTVDFMTAEN
jgi:5-methyltetrahydrofolate--homocysteine methyltransferase